MILNRDKDDGMIKVCKVAALLQLNFGAMLGNIVRAIHSSDILLFAF